MSELYLLKEHREWIGLIQPVGLVVSPSALANAQLRIQKDVFNLQDTFRSITDEKGLLPLHLSSLFTRVLGWRSDDLVSGETVRSLDVFLPEREAYLKADYAVKNAERGEIDILIKYVDQLQFDEEETPEGRGWQASPHAKFERHLREKNLSIGILINQFGLRLIYSPKGETSGYLTFPFAFMRETQGRPVLAALHLLLCEDRLFKGDPKQRLQNLLIESRKFQNEVSTKLSEQVLAALYELVRGLQEADEDAKGKLLEDVLKRDKNEVYHSLLTVLLRTVFTLYAEDRDLLSSDPVFLNNYSINGLFARLREDASKHHDSMNLRYGAWAHLLSLFRLIYEGIDLETDSIPGRKGHLFDPDRFPFLEGRAKPEDPFKPPRISDGVVWRVLSNLMTLDGERISYRALDVEQIGSVYETVMGFQLEIATGPSIAIKPAKSHGAPIVINLAEVLTTPVLQRSSKIKEETELKIDQKLEEKIKIANTPNDLVLALSNKVAEWATPTIVSAGAMILQPSDERRRSGSHYTPRSMTGPIVEKALEPILLRLGKNPKPDQILELRVCDPAMGSGAFLVESCRQLSEILVNSWAFHRPDIRNEIPPDEDELLYARRMIAQRCLYGVDKNPMAVNLAKLSLWLVTFAKQHEFTFLDHCLKFGDSLIGLTNQQVLNLDFRTSSQMRIQQQILYERLNTVRALRKSISDSKDNCNNDELISLNQKVDDVLLDLISAGNIVVYSHIAGETETERKRILLDLQIRAENWLASKLPISAAKSFKTEFSELKKHLSPFHWGLEFPEVFEKKNPGFDLFVGNPPFLGGRDITNVIGKYYNSLLSDFYENELTSADLSSYFFRRAFELLNEGGALGFIATNTISQGTTLSNGLEKVVSAGGLIYCAVTDMEWPGVAGVTVSVLHLVKKIKHESLILTLNGDKKSSISARLQDEVVLSEPKKILSNSNKCFVGATINGDGFLLTPEEKNDLIERDPVSSEVIRPYLTGEDLNDSGPIKNKSFVINFGEMSESEARKYRLCFDRVERLVKPIRLEITCRRDVREKWWLLQRRTPDLDSAVAGLEFFLARSRVSGYHSITFLKPGYFLSDQVIVFAFDSFFHFGILQSMFHESWCWKYSSTMGKALRYTVKACFLNFPFPETLPTSKEGLEVSSVAKELYEFRSTLMAELDLGLTKVYSLYHSPTENRPQFEKLRLLHAALDESVAKAYGWSDINMSHAFIDLTGGDEARSKKRQYRYKWPVDVENKILSKLLKLNLTKSDSGDSQEEEDDL